MQGIGQSATVLVTAARPTRAPRAALGWALAGAVCAGLPAAWMWGFTVDDALISVRYAEHLAAGLGWRFNAGGAPTDGVTPLPWPLVLAPFAYGDPWHVLTRAKAIGFAAHVGTGALVGRAAARASGAAPWARAAVLFVLALSIPVAAHAVSGMETALAMLLATGAVASERALLSAALAGGAAAFRPEMAPWALALTLGLGMVRHDRPSIRAASGAWALGPFVACAFARVAIWGRAAPLAVLAKPSSVAFGLPYTGAALVVSVVPVLVLAPWALRRSPRALSIVGAAGAHAVVLVVVGGDWMPYARLWAPIVPSLAIAALLACEHAGAIATAIRAGAGLALGTFLVARGGTSGRTVGSDRHALIAAARPWLSPYARVAALDIGWVGAATARDVVDLAGVTDPEVAALPGGHTSKRVGAMFLLGRDPGALLLYAGAGLPGDDLAAWRDAAYGRVVEARLARDEVIARHFAPVAWLPLGDAGAGYVLLARRP